ncbi:MAG: response regulator transcription factor [Clostridia bacterium]|nr:response regulator transcription factor [Clostridia bacterium]
MPSVLFVDDDKNILRINRVYFESRGYEVFTAESRERAEETLHTQTVDCVVLDILMPGTDGWELCRAFRAETTVPILFLTSLTERDCLYRGFELGADDYITKPYELRELEARVKARILRGKSAPKLQELLSFPPLTIDPAGRRVLVDDRSVALTAYEFDILLLLSREPGRVFSLENIYQAVWGLPDLGSCQTVRVHLARMRHKLEEACPRRRYIELVWGKGFKFDGNG